MLIEGQHLGEFEVLEHLGQGGMGTVFKARQTSLRRVVALKTLKPFLSGNSDYVARFHQEAVAAAALNHSNLVHVYAAGEAEGIHYIAMEYVEGESAQKRLAREGRMEPAKAIGIGIHVAGALGYAWQRARIIHRDIKPDNIFLSADGEVKLGDLGLAKSLEESQSLTVTGSSMGTPHYISPEQAEGSKDIDLRADIYSLGCTLYHLLTGQTPYHGSNAMAVMMKQVSAPPPDIRKAWPACPPALDAAITRMLQKDPAARYQSYEELIADLRRASEQLSAPPAAPAPRRKPVLAWTAGGSLALAVVAGAIFLGKPNAKVSGGSDAVSARTPPGNLPQPTPKPPAAATKDAPFVNTLGMKFVPVPGTKVLFSIWDTRVQDYAAYARVNRVDDSWQTQQKDGTPVSREPEYPVVGVSWEDAQAFCQWLTEKESAEGKFPKGAKYRLPTDEEWSHAAGLASEQGATPAEKHQKNQVDFPWGIGYPPKATLGNYADVAWHEKFPKEPWIDGYTDGYATTSPVGSFPANAFGLYDMGGNVWQLCEDWVDASQKQHVLRGASWINFEPNNLLLSYRYRREPSGRGTSHGFRCVLELAPVTAPAVVTLDTATTDTPFVNTLRMRFVPVPILGGPTGGQRVLFSVWDTRVQDYEVFAKETKREWPAADFPQGPTHPAVNVSWEDARLFCQWLTGREHMTGRLPAEWRYRLPSDHEWSCAVELGAREDPAKLPSEKSQRLGDTFPWGTQWPPPENTGNYASVELNLLLAAGKYTDIKEVIPGYRDGYANTSPVGSFPASRFGLYDMGGNVQQWCEDWYDKDPKGRILRGASWKDNDRASLLSSRRFSVPPTARNRSFYGFRCVIELSPPALAAPPQSVSATPVAATKDAPFQNTLGMKFVPVPILGGPTSEQRVLFSVWDTRVQDYEVFVKETGRDWPKTDFAQGPTHPAAMVNWEDANIFCQWLTAREQAAGRLPAAWIYRLPSDHEWSCAVELGAREDAAMLPSEKDQKITTAFPWGTQWPPPEKAGNYASEELKPLLAAGKYTNIKDVVPGYYDGYANTSPVGSFPANRFGLYDMGGNVWQWCEDWFDKDQTERVIRGASWNAFDRRGLLLSCRGHYAPMHRYDVYGFRCVLGARALVP